MRTFIGSFLACVLGCASAQPGLVGAGVKPALPAPPDVTVPEGHRGIAIDDDRPKPRAFPLSDPRQDRNRLRQAKHLYLQGYQQKEADPGAAIALFKQVLALTAPDEELHRKAKMRLENLAADGHKLSK